MEQVIWLSIVTASIVFTLTETKLFLPLREWIDKHSKFLGKLVNCGYCTGYWIAFALTAIYKPRLFYGFGLLDYFLTALVIAWLGALEWVVMCALFRLGGK